MLAFWLDPAAALPIEHPRGHINIEEALARARLGTERRVTRPLQGASLIITDGGPSDWFAIEAHWGLVPPGTPREAMREAASRNLVVRIDRARGHPATSALWQLVGAGEKTRRQCLVPVSGWIARGDRGLVAEKPEGGWAMLAAIYNTVQVDGKVITTFTILISEWASTYRDGLRSMPVAIGSNRRTSWMHALNPAGAIRWSKGGLEPVDRRRLRQRR